MNTRKFSVSAVVIVAALAALAQPALAVDPDYGAILTTNLATVNTLWGTVATIMIGVALVVVGLRFFKKVK